jgi:hypothetical protein
MSNSECKAIIKLYVQAHQLCMYNFTLENPFLMFINRVVQVLLVLHLGSIHVSFATTYGSSTLPMKLGDNLSLFW